MVSVDARRVHISGVKNVEYQVSVAAHLLYIHMMMVIFIT